MLGHDVLEADGLAVTRDHERQVPLLRRQAGPGPPPVLDRAAAALGLRHVRPRHRERHEGGVVDAGVDGVEETGEVVVGRDPQLEVLRPHTEVEQRPERVGHGPL